MPFVPQRGRFQPGALSSGIAFGDVGRVFLVLQLAILVAEVSPVLRNRGNDEGREMHPL
jgi:hypothetical protein